MVKSSHSLSSLFDVEENELPAPSLGEIGRSVIKTEQSVADLRRELAETYVRQDVWQMAQANAGQRVGEVNDKVSGLTVIVERLVTSRENDRRLVMTALIAPIITGLVVGLILFLVQRGGA